MQAVKIGSAIMMLVLTLTCGPRGPGNETLGRQDPIPTPDRSQVQIIEDDVPAGLTGTDAISAYQQSYAHMRAAAWFSDIAAYDEAIHIQPAVSGLYEARGTAYMYAGRHDQALADYSRAIELNPNDAGHWRRRAHAYTIAPTPEPYKGADDATQANKAGSGTPGALRPRVGLPAVSEYPRVEVLRKVHVPTSADRSRAQQRKRAPIGEAVELVELLKSLPAPLQIGAAPDLPFSIFPR